MKLFYTKHTGDGHNAVYRLLDYAIKTEYGIATPEIVKTEHGKPYFSNRSEIHFSLSHTKQYALCAVADFPIGCDIEQTRHISEKVITRCCSPAELVGADFFTLWTLKESYIKLIGHQTHEVREIVFIRSGSTFTCFDENVKSMVFSFDDLHIAACSYKEMYCVPKFIPFDMLY